MRWKYSKRKGMDNKKITEPFRHNRIYTQTHRDSSRMHMNKANRVPALSVYLVDHNVFLVHKQGLALAQEQ